MIRFDFSTYMNNYVSKYKLKSFIDSKDDIKNYLSAGDMRGWYSLDDLFDELLIKDIKDTSKFIKNNADVFLVIGVGGSYMGACSVIESLSPYFYNQTKKPSIYFLGHNLSSKYYSDLLKMIEDKKVIVNFISKSGRTLEIDIAYQVIMEFMNKKYDEEELRQRVIMTTDEFDGFLREETNKYGFKSFVIPKNIGGRYSVFTPVGLLPISVSGIDIDELYRGARDSFKNIDEMIYYAGVRNELFKQKRYVESFVVYEPKLYFFTEWLKQLYGESLGKNNQGILPISFINTRDLHSLGQFVQEGNKILFETMINIRNTSSDIQIEKYNKSMFEINNIVSISVSEAHLQGDVPSILIELEEISPYTIGYLLQFFMTSCAISGYIEGVNPFNQDGVEQYKKIITEKLEK